MVKLFIIGLFWAILFIIAFVFIPVWRRRHDEESGLYARSQEDNKLSVNYALKKLNCKVRWEQDHDDLLAQYDFQSGHFRIRLEKNSPYVRLYFFFFFETDLNDIELVRDVCNQCNQSTETCRLVYSVGEKQGTVNVHIISVLLITDSTVKEVLERAMLNIFSWQNAFVRRYNELKGDANHEVNPDPEKERASVQRELFLVREQEMMLQDEGPDWHEQSPDSHELRTLLAQTLGLSDVVPARLTICSDDSQVQTLDNPDRILAFRPATTIIENGAFKNQSSFMKLDYYDPRRPSRLRHITLDIEQEGSTDKTLYYRATLCLVPLSMDEEVESGSAETQRQTCSVLLGHDIASSKEVKDEFRYIWKEAKAKQKGTSTEKLTDDESLLLKMQDPQTGYEFFQGKSLYLEKRFYEAVLHFENVFHNLQEALAKQNTGVQDAFFEVCYLIGSCYTSLKQYRRACFYLDFTLPLHRVIYTEVYVNCLVNARDFRAMNVINSLLQEIQPGDDDGDSDDTLQPFRNFLLRRKAFLLIGQKHFDEAEAILKQLLNDPDNSDYALRELAYIQKLKAKE